MGEPLLATIQQRGRHRKAYRKQIYKLKHQKRDGSQFFRSFLQSVDIRPFMFIAVQLVKRAGVISKAVKAKDVGCIKINSLLLGVCLLGFCLWMSIDRVTDSVGRVWCYFVN